MFKFVFQPMRWTPDAVARNRIGWNPKNFNILENSILGHATFEKFEFRADSIRVGWNPKNLNILKILQIWIIFSIPHFRPTWIAAATVAIINLWPKTQNQNFNNRNGF